MELSELLQPPAWMERYYRPGAEFRECRTFRQPLPVFFGLRVRFDRLVTYGQLILERQPQTTAARIAGIDPFTGLTFLDRAGLPYDPLYRETRRINEEARQAAERLNQMKALEEYATAIRSCVLESDMQKMERTYLMGNRD